LVITVVRVILFFILKLLIFFEIYKKFIIVIFETVKSTSLEGWMGGWVNELMGGCKSCFNDCLQQSKMVQFIVFFAQKNWIGFFPVPKKYELFSFCNGNFRINVERS
jgi:hypothetical protein